MTDAPDVGDWICIRSADAKKQIDECSLVLSAVALTHRVDAADGTWRLWVPAPVAHDAELQLRRYQQENRQRYVRPREPPVMDSGWAGVIGYLLVIWALPWIESVDLVHVDWRAAGNMHAGLVVDGQWWRTITALTLHADLGHIFSNSVFGAGFGWLVGRYMGSGFGWLLILLAGAAGNAINAWIQPSEFRAIGASTATFAALGVYATFIWQRGYYRGRGWRRSLAPVFGAVALLIFTGLGGGEEGEPQNIDVMGHILGFAMGLILGASAAQFDIRRLGQLGQRVAGAIAVTIVLLAWEAAIGASGIG